MKGHRWFRVGMFHLVFEPLLERVSTQVEGLRDPRACAVEAQEAYFSLSGAWLPACPRTLSVELVGLSLEIPVLDAERLRARLPYLPEMAGGGVSAYVLEGSARVLYLTEPHRRVLSTALGTLLPSVRQQVQHDRGVVERSVSRVEAWQSPRRMGDLHS